MGGQEPVLAFEYFDETSSAVGVPARQLDAQSRSIDEIEEATAVRGGRGNGRGLTIVA
jgi:hypothetical protein